MQRSCKPSLNFFTLTIGTLGRNHMTSAPWTELAAGPRDALFLLNSQILLVCTSSKSAVRHQLERPWKATVLWMHHAKIRCIIAYKLLKLCINCIIFSRPKSVCHLCTLTNDKQQKHSWVTFITHISQKTNIFEVENVQIAHCGCVIRHLTAIWKKRSNVCLLFFFLVQFWDKKIPGG